MGGYIQKTLIKIQHLILKNPEDVTFKADPKKYGSKVQFAK